MAKTGRKPYETTEMTAFGGGNRRLQPPDCLGNLQKQAFIDLVASCPASQFRGCDVVLLSRWAELTVMAETAQFEMQQGGIVTPDGRQSACVGIYERATRELRLLSQRLQIGPRGRTPKAPKTQAGRVSVYDRMRLAGELDDVDPN